MAINSSTFETKFYECCSTLTKEDILKLNESDNGPLNNVISGINKECFGVALYEAKGTLAVEMFYVFYDRELRGDIFSIELDDPDYFTLLLRFCHLLEVDYEGVDAIVAFNTFQIQLRTFLEKYGFFTTTTLELKEFIGKNATMLAPKKIKILDLIDKVVFFRDFFQNNYKSFEEGEEHVYLMVNTDTALVKIGFSKKPRYREKTLQSQEPNVQLIACWKLPKEKEKQLHLKFKHKRVRGEWFRLNLHDLKEIETFMNSNI